MLSSHCFRSVLAVYACTQKRYTSLRYVCYALHQTTNSADLFYAHFLSCSECLYKWLSAFQNGIVEVGVCVCVRRWNEIELINIELGDYLFIGRPLTLWPLTCGVVSRFAVIVIVIIITTTTMVVAVLTATDAYSCCCNWLIFLIILWYVSLVCLFFFSRIDRQVPFR